MLNIDWNTTTQLSIVMDVVLLCKAQIIDGTDNNLPSLVGTL